MYGWRGAIKSHLLANWPPNVLNNGYIEHPSFLSLFFIFLSIKVSAEFSRSLINYLRSHWLTLDSVGGKDHSGLIYLQTFADYLELRFFQH